MYVLRREHAVLVAPVPDRDGRDSLRLCVHRHCRANALETGQVVDPQRDRNVVLGLQLAGQAPADADVAVVVDDAAENGKGKGGGHNHQDEACARKKTGAPVRMRVGLLRFSTGVPKGIRTPVLTVKG
jgi:hypothetical protein